MLGLLKSSCKLCDLVALGGSDCTQYLTIKVHTVLTNLGGGAGTLSKRERQWRVFDTRLEDGVHLIIDGEEVSHTLHRNGTYYQHAAPPK